MRRLLLPELCLGIVLLAACAQQSVAEGPVATASVAGQPSPSPSAAPTIDAATRAGIRVEIRQSRSDWAARVVQLRVFNDGPSAVTVSAASLTTSVADGEASVVPDQQPTIRTGRDRDLSVQLGAPVCPPGKTAEPGDAHATVAPATDALVTDALATGALAGVALVTDTGARGEVEVAVGDPQGHLARIHAEDCAAAAVAAGLTLSLDTGLRTQQEADGLVGSLGLTATPVPGGPPVQVTRLDSTVLLTPLIDGAAATAWSPPELSGPVSSAVAVLLAFAPARCDPHAVAEDKRGTFIAVHATVAGVEQPVFYLGVDDETRAAVHDYIGLACGW